MDCLRIMAGANTNDSNDSESCGLDRRAKEFYGKPPYRPDDTDGWNILLKEYAEVGRRVTKSHGVALVDFYKIFKTYGGQEGHDLNDLMLDGMHPNDLGHSLIADSLLETTGPLLLYSHP